MKLFELLAGSAYSLKEGGDCEILGLTIDSRTVKKGYLYVCIKGIHADGHDFIGSAVENGAAAILCENAPGGKTGGAVVSVENARIALGAIASHFYGDPLKDIKLIGVTGTNGKTSSTYFMEEVLKDYGKKVGVIGTTGAMLGGEKIAIPYATSTTPDTIELYQIMREMADRKAEYIVMEVSSHALALDKVSSMRFEIGIFTNLTQDHLDFHGTLDEYLKAKAKLFSLCKTGIINADDSASQYLVEHSDCGIVTYGIDSPSDYRAAAVQLLGHGIAYRVSANGGETEFTIPVPGKFTVYNTLGVVAAACALGIPIDAVSGFLQQVRGVPGRIQSVPNERGLAVVVDYAHSPDGLENIIRAVREFTKGRVITVFGCGGDRDKTKRPIMGRVAGELSDYCFITSDNPRNEVPGDIIAQVEEGTRQTSCQYTKMADRQEAIFAAVGMALAGDSVIIAGKGHENYQEFENKRKIHFDDTEVAAAALQK